MNMFEKTIEEFYDDEEIDGYCNEDFDDVNITYQNDTVRLSYSSEKYMIECGFLQDNVKVYFTFISEDFSSFSENYLQEILTAITQSDADCAEKFDSLCELILGEKIDISIDNNTEHGFSLKCSRCGEHVIYANGNMQQKYSNMEFAACSGFYNNNTKVNVCFCKDNDITAIRDNVKIIELANRLLPYEKRFENCFNNFIDCLNRIC